MLAHFRQKRPQRPKALAARASQLNQTPMPGDYRFVDRAVKGGIFGLLLGTLGIEKSQNPEIRAFAEKLVHENQAINIALTSISQKKGISAVRTLDPSQRSLILQLSQLSGPEFENRFLVMALAEDQKFLEIFQQQIKSGKDKDLQKFASSIVPKLKTHIKLCSRLNT